MATHTRQDGRPPRGGGTVATAAEGGSPEFDHVEQSAWDRLARRRIFFGHQSVGRDIMNGVRQVLEEHPGIGLRLVETDEPGSVEGPALMDARIGRNREPWTKLDAFTGSLEGGFASEAAPVAMVKYCYVDVRPETDPGALFEDYVARMETLRKRHPGLLLAHVTIPLRVAPTGMGESLKTRMGRPTATLLNWKRERFNRLMWDRYRGRAPVFDLAATQSRRADGSIAWSPYRGQRVPMLAPEWTHDGGHLNEAAQVRVARRFLAFLANLPDGGDTSGADKTLADAGRTQ